MWGLYDKAIGEIKTKLQQSGFEIVDSADWADYTLNLNHSLTLQEKELTNVSRMKSRGYGG